MRNFRRVAAGIDTSGIHSYLEAHPTLWQNWMDPEQHDAIKAAHGVWPRLQSDPRYSLREAIMRGARETLLLRYLVRGRKPLDCAPDIDALATWARGTVSTVADLLGATDVGGVALAKVDPGEGVGPHVDAGGSWLCKRCRRAGAADCRYFARYQYRYHCVITTNPDCWFECGGERVHMAQGELWWFDNRAVHSVQNDGRTARVHLIVDARTQSGGP